MTQLREVVIVSAVRTPIGRFNGGLSQVRPDDLAAVAISEAVKRAKVAPAEIEEVFFGCANQAGEDNRNVARMAALLAGLPNTVAAVTINRLCASGLSAINQAARAIRCGEGDVYVAGGVESMTRAPYSLAKNAPPGNHTAWDTSLGWRYPNPKLAALFPLEAMGETAENIAERTGITRDEQDRFALQSQTRAAAAMKAGRFADELVAVPVPGKKGAVDFVAVDEHPRADSDLAQLGKLKAAFRTGGTVTAGNSSGLNDGAAALVLMSAERAKALGVEPLAKWRASATSGIDPRVMGLGPVEATHKVLRRAGLSVADVKLAELNEAFAVQALAVLRELHLSEELTNVNGGAIALGHPLGCSGARIVATLVHEMKRRDVTHGLAALCVGVGQGEATVLTRD